MSSKKISREELVSENANLKARLKYGITRNWMDVVSHFFNTIPKYTAYCIISWMFYLSIKELSGEITIANIDISGMLKYITETETNDPKYFLWMSFFGNVVFGLVIIRGNAKRRRLIKNQSKLQQKYHNRIDPGKLSSGLDSTGQPIGETE